MFGKKTAQAGRKIERKAVNHEQAMLEYAQKMCDYRRKASVVVVRLSRATGFGYDNYLYAINMFKGLVARFQGELFVLSNRDLVFAYHGPAGEPAVKTAIFNVRLLFDVPSDESDSDDFASWFDLELNYRDFLRYAEQVLEEKNKGASTRKSGELFAERQDAAEAVIEPPTLERYGQFMNLLNAAELGTLVRRQVIVETAGDGFRPLFHELYVSIADLEKKLMPNVRLTQDRNLFQYLTHELDKRVLKLLKQQMEMLPGMNFSINLNTSSFLTPEFDEFDAVLPDESRRTIILEFPRNDILADIGMFLFVRDQARERGYKTCMDGLSAMIMPYIRLQDLGFDLMKVNWSREMASGEYPELRRLLEGVVTRCQDTRIVLCHCDSDDAVNFGKEIGIQTFQGRHIDTLMTRR